TARLPNDCPGRRLGASSSLSVLPRLGNTVFADAEPARPPGRENRTMKGRSRPYREAHFSCPRKNQGCEIDSGNREHSCALPCPRNAKAPESGAFGLSHGADGETRTNSICH